MKVIKNWGLSLFVIGSFVLACSRPEATRHEFVFKGDTMGTYWVSKVVSSVAITDTKKLEEIQVAIENELKQVNQDYSTYINDSLIEKFNQHNSVQKFLVHAEFISILKIAKEVHVKSNGLYDITIDPLVRLWGFGPNKVTKAPLDNNIKQTLKYVGMDKLSWDERTFTVTKSHANLKLDLSSIAKGRGVDRVLYLLRTRYAFENVLVEIGGEVSARGKNKHNQYWSVGVELPAEELGSGVAKVIELHSQSIATSGSYRNWKKYDNKKYSHTIDPKTGRPVESDLISVSVIADDCTTADAWATALMAMGSKTAINKANELKLKVIMLIANVHGAVDIVESESMKVK